MRPTSDGESGDLWGRLLELAVVGLMLVVLIANSLRLDDAMRPRTGDVISFQPRRSVTSRIQATIKAVPIGNSTSAACVLDPQVMAASGGSLVIEAMQLQPRVNYRVHWAGARTSDTGVDCGPSAELLLSPAEILSLSLAASRRG